MTYTELYPALIHKKLVQPRSPPPVPEKLPWWYKADATCAFHQNAPGHDLENCWPLKNEVQRLVRSGMLFRTFGDFQRRNPPIFEGGYGPDKAHSWMREIEKIFQVVSCTDVQKVQFGTHMLTKEVDVW